MTDGTRNRSVSGGGASYAPEAFRSLLLPLDLSPVSDRVVRRAALLPVPDGARLTLVHVVPNGLPSRARRRAERDAKSAVADERAALAKALPGRVRVKGIVTVGAPASEIAACADAVEAELVVMGRGGGRGLSEAFLGSTGERVIRRFVKKERPDLLALATHGYRGAAPAFLGTVAGDVLRQVTCDGLVVPPQRENTGTT